jgi:hypothetical protein
MQKTQSSALRGNKPTCVKTPKVSPRELVMETFVSKFRSNFQLIEAAGIGPKFAVHWNRQPDAGDVKTELRRIQPRRGVLTFRQS